VILAQYATDIFFVVTEVYEECIKNMIGGTRSTNPFNINAFLKMRLLGPLRIYSAAGMRVFGFLVVALTTVHHRDWKKSMEN
jgi:hypothetical protein